MKKLMLISLWSLAAAMSGCGDMRFPPIEAASRIEVTANNELLKTITDPQEIAAVRAFVNARGDGWGGIRDAAGVPVPVVILDFYAEEEFLGHFGIGPGFFETQRVGDFASRSASPEEQAELESLLQLPKSAYLRK